MNKPQFETIAQAFHGWGDVHALAKEYGLQPEHKFAGQVNQYSPGFSEDALKNTTLPIAVVEKRWVYPPDVMYDFDGGANIAGDVGESSRKSFFNRCSWNPPQPETITVEIPKPRNITYGGGELGLVFEKASEAREAVDAINNPTKGDTIHWYANIEVKPEEREGYEIWFQFKTDGDSIARKATPALSWRFNTVNDIARYAYIKGV